MKKYIIGFSLLWTSIFTPSVYSLNILEPVLDPILNLTEDEVEQRIGKIQNEVPVGTPTISGGFDQKGYVGSILANIFDEATQKIKSNFILAFTDILGATHNNNIPKWNGNMFKPGTISDVGGSIGIGTSTPTTKLDVAGHIRTTNQVRANNYCDTDGNNCFQAGNLPGGTDNCWVCGDNGVTVQCKKFGSGWVNAVTKIQISCNVGGTYTKTGYCKSGNSQGGLFAPSSASCSKTVTCNSGDIALRGRGWNKGAGSNYASSLNYNDTTAWHNQVDNGLSGKTWGNPSTSNSFTFSASYSNGLGDKHEYIILGAEIECLDL